MQRFSLARARRSFACAFLVLSPTTASAEFIVHTAGAESCPSNTRTPTLSKCEDEVAAALAARGYQWAGTSARCDYPEGCYVDLRTNELHYNDLWSSGGDAQANINASVVCQAQNVSRQLQRRQINAPSSTSTSEDEDRKGSGDSMSIIWIACFVSGILMLVACISFAVKVQRINEANARYEKAKNARRTQPEPQATDTPAAVPNGGKATMRSDSKELVEPLNEMARRSLPKYWTGCRESGNEEANVNNDLGFDNLVYVQHEHMQFFQELANYTYRQIPTQDRLCPTGQHDKTKGGCPCVQPGGDPGLPTGYQIKRVIRVENSAMFTRYIDRRDQIKRSRSSCEAPDPKIFTHAKMEAASGLTDVLCDVDGSINEVYLWHGTQVRAGLAIAQSDFSLNFAGSGGGTMYGKGLYFSESCTKADEYALNEPRGHYDGVRGLLLCRVCLGKFHYTLDREPSAIEKYTNGECDSTIGDRAKAANTYREMVVYDRDQVYPEYLVLYERLQKGEMPQLPPKDVPFLLELPLYWRNVGRNPYTEGFREQWLVKPMIHELIQRLANGSCGRDGATPKVFRARRIEDSVLWCRYIDWKRSLGASLNANGELKCTPPNELDGNLESGHALTATILAEFHCDEAISVENMAPGLNEMLLWHGTSQEAADAIAGTGFEINTSGTHGRRFGDGVYLAEDLNKSLSYCTSSFTANGNVKYVLLCRAVCGHIYYTEERSCQDATSEALQLGKHSVLANPEGIGPREYIVLKKEHVYPEYIVEFED